MVDHEFHPAAWEEPWTFGTACLTSDNNHDCVRPKSDFTDDPTVNIYAFAWNVDFEFDQTDWPYQLANNDYKVVMTPASHLYLDHPEEPDSEERGFYWAARYTDMKRILGFQPFDLYQNSFYGVNWSPLGPGAPIPPNYKCETHGDQACIALTKPENIVGLQCSTWSETLLTDEMLTINIYPRLFACAERAANPRPTFDTIDTADFTAEWEAFVRKTPKYIRKLEAKDITYRLPVVGFKNGEANSQVNRGDPLFRHHKICYQFRLITPFSDSVFAYCVDTF